MRRYRKHERRRHLQAVLPHGPGTEAPDPGGGRRFPVRRELRHRTHNLRLGLGGAGPQLLAERLVRHEPVQPGAPGRRGQGQGAAEHRRAAARRPGARSQDRHRQEGGPSELVLVFHFIFIGKVSFSKDFMLLVSTFYCYCSFCNLMGYPSDFTFFFFKV